MTISDLSTTDHAARGDHVGAVYDTDDGWEALVTVYVRSGLAGGNRVEYFCSERHPGTVLAALAAAGIDTGAEQARGALKVVAGEYPDNPADFDGAAMVATLGDAIDTAHDDGFAGIRFLGEMGWAASAPEHLDSYEQLVTDYYENRAVDGLCLYDARLFSGPAFEHLIEMHPTIGHVE